MTGFERRTATFINRLMITAFALLAILAMMAANVVWLKAEVSALRDQCVSNSEE